VAELTRVDPGFLKGSGSFRGMRFQETGKMCIPKLKGIKDGKRQDFAGDPHRSLQVDPP